MQGLWEKRNSEDIGEELGIEGNRYFLMLMEELQIKG